MSLADMLRDEARTSGVDALAFASAEPFEGRGIAASRLDPGRALRGAQSIVVAAKYIGGAVQEGTDVTAASLGRLTLSGFFSDVVRPLEAMAAVARARCVSGAVHWERSSPTTCGGHAA